MLRKLLLGSAASAIAVISIMPSQALAQSQSVSNAGGSTVIMRRPLVSKTRSFEWTVDQWSECSNSCGDGQRIRKAQCVLNGQYVYPDQHCTSEKPAETQACTDFSGCSYQWEEKTPWTDVKGCGDVAETREMQCRRSEGTVVGRDLCPQPVPDETRKVEDLRTCSYAWDPKDWSAYSSECSAEAVRNRKVDCLRSNGQTVSDSFCATSGEKPVLSETAERTSQCGYSWKAKEWGAFDSTCATAAVHKREVVCLRSDGVEVAEGLCGAAGAKPAVSETQPQYGSCTFSWIQGEFGDPAPACGKTVSTRTVQCRRSNGDFVDDAQCASGGAGAKPSTTEDRTDYSTCTYGYVEGSWGPWSSTCGQGTRTRDVSCMSSDGRKVSDAQCGGDKPAMSESDYRTEGCTTSWQDGIWSRVPGCGASSDVRTPTCLRSDGQTVADGQCAPGGKPATSRPATDYQTCSYGWDVGSWGGWSATCGNASQTRSVTCQSSDGRSVDDSFCSSTLKPAVSQESYQTQGCARNWVPGAWGASDRTCSSAATQTRPVACMRSDGQISPDAECTSAKPAVAQTVADYSGCVNYWVPLTGFSDWDNHCSANSTRTRTVSCIRNEWNCDPNSANLVAYHPGASTDCARSIPDSSCAAQPMPARSESGAVFDQCGYSAVNPSEWSGWDNACSATAGRTRHYQCRRGDGTIVPDGECTSRSVVLDERQVGANYTNACPGFHSTGASPDYNSHCSGSATRTRDVACYRSGDNVFAGDQYCIDRGVSVPPRSETGPVFDQCGYTWQVGGFGAPAAACGASSQSRSVWCQRADGATVGEGFCDAASRPSPTQPATDYGACSYGWAENGWRTTSQTCGSTTQTHDVWCRRADGVTVADGYCPAGRPANDRTYTDYSACSYAWTPGSFSTPSACGATTATRAVPCTRQDGAVVADAYCGGGQPSTTTPTADYSACGYNWRAGGFGAPDPACGASTQWRDVWCERTDGARVADGSCGAGRPSNTQWTTDYRTCGYQAYQTVGYSDWSSHCGPASRTRYHNCLRGDGTIVDNAECTNRGVAVSAVETSAVYDGCGYDFVPGAWSGWSSTCSSNARRARAVWCYRSDGTMMDPDHSPCYNAGKAYPGYEEYKPVYEGCGYDFVPGAWSDWSSHCSSNARRARAVWCYRSDGTMMDPDHSSCYNAGKSYPGYEEYQPIYDQCGYSAVNWSGYGACNNGTKTQTAQCQRSNGDIVGSAECTNRGIAVVDNQPCQTACIRRTSGSVYVDRGVEGAQNFTTTDGTVRYLGTTRDNYNYACGRRITGSMSVTANGVTQNVSSTCTVPSGSPSSCSQTTVNNVGGVDFTVFTRITSFQAQAQNCQVTVSINQPYPSC